MTTQCYISKTAGKETWCSCWAAADVEVYFQVVIEAKIEINANHVGYRLGPSFDQEA